MTKKTLLAVLVVVIAMFSFSATIAFADTDEDPTPVYTDGRLNDFDVDATVAVYRTSETVPLLDEDGVQVWAEIDEEWQMVYEDQFTGYEFYAYTSSGSIDKIAEVTAEMIDAAVGTSILVQAEGYSVTYDAASSTFMVVAPNGYTYSWIG